MGAVQGHMVSKGYIAAWADKRNTVDVIDIQGRRGYPSSIEAATTVGDVYDPAVLAHNLEAAYADVETDGIPVLVRLRDGAQSLSEKDREVTIAFLDMHLDRGRYADRADLRASAQVLLAGGEVRETELRLGDALLLSQSIPEVLRLKTLGLEAWEWRLWPTEELITGDGAVLLWPATEGADICTVTFPLSPNCLLIIGKELPDGVPMNDRIASNSKRWIVGARGSLNLNWAVETAT